jgi:DNA-binding response OmpR family regulator
MGDRIMTALIIEDDYSIFSVLELMLEGKNISARHADSIASTKLLLKDFSPDIIFIDHFLSDGLGIEFIPYLRMNFLDCRIITMTAQNSAETKEKALSNGSDYFLEKPFTLHDVYESLNIRMMQNKNYK